MRWKMLAAGSVPFPKSLRDRIAALTNGMTIDLDAEIRSPILAAIRETAEDLASAGLMDKQTMREFAFRSILSKNDKLR